VKKFRGGLVFKAHRLVYHSALGVSVKKKKKKESCPSQADGLTKLESSNRLREEFARPERSKHF
jgi:hypothetical protein